MGQRISIFLPRNNNELVRLYSHHYPITWLQVVLPAQDPVSNGGGGVKGECSSNYTLLYVRYSSLGQSELCL